MNGITKEMFLGAKQEQRDEYFWDAFQTINGNLEQICKQPEECKKVFVTWDRVKNWRTIFVVALACYLIGMGTLAAKELWAFVRLLGF